MVFALLSQSIVMLFFSCILDGGIMAGLYFRALIIFWVAVAWRSFRCHGQWTGRQLAVVRMGALPLTLLVMALIGVLQRLWETLGIIRS